MDRNSIAEQVYYAGANRIFRQPRRFPLIAGSLEWEMIVSLSGLPNPKCGTDIGARTISLEMEKTRAQCLSTGRASWHDSCTSRACAQHASFSAERSEVEGFCGSNVQGCTAGSLEFPRDDRWERCALTRRICNERRIQS